MKENISILIPMAASGQYWLSIIAIFIIAFFGAFVGGLTGLGGGMLIKPILGNTLGMATSKISLYASKFISTSVVFSMSIKSSSIYKREGFKFNMEIFKNISIGLVIGILNVDFIPLKISPGAETFLQGILYILVFLSVLLRDKYPRLNYSENRFATIFVGFIIGFLASFFGIGGGAIKVPFFIIFFSMTMKEAAIYSFLVSMVTEPLKLFQYGIHIFNLPEGGLSMLGTTAMLSVICIPAAIIGATLGVRLQKKSSDKFVANSFNLVIIYFAIESLVSGLLMLNGYEPISLFWSLITFFNII